MAQLNKVNNVLHLRLSAKDTEETIRRLERAAMEHSKWINDLSRSLICHLPIEEKHLDVKASKKCNFGQWYYNKSSKNLSNYPGFVLIEKIHRDMHKQSRILAEKILQGHSPTTDDYDELIHYERQLSISLLKLRDEFYKLLFAFDPLTGLLTRQAFLIILSQEYARISRSQEPCCISMVDLDHFKSVNDTHGHQSGDKVLESAAQYFLGELRPYDSIARYGGEEFLVCLPNTTTDSALHILNRLRLGLEELLIPIGNHKSVKITASFGIAKLEKNFSLLEAISMADEALYDSKNHGRNKVSIWQEKK